MAWKLLHWLEQEAVELLSKGLELLAEDIVDGPRTDDSYLRKLPLHEWGLDHCPAIPYWADRFGDPDMKHTLATLAKLNARGEEGIDTAYKGLSTSYTIQGQTHNAYEFLYGAPRPGTGDDPPTGTRPPNLLRLGHPGDFTISWTNYHDVYKDSLDLAMPFVETLTSDQAATEAFWPTIASFGLPYNLLVLAKPDADRARDLERDFGDAWKSQDLGAHHAQGRLYEIDMTIFESLGPYDAIDGKVRFTPATVTLLTQDPKTKALTPVAIKVWWDHGPTYVYTGDSNAWRYALQAAKASITVWGIWLGHVYHWHIVTAAMQMSMYNHLPKGHKLYPLMQPQSQSLIDFDHILLTQLWGQIAPPTPVGGMVALAKLLNTFAADREFFHDDPHCELHERGLEEKDFREVTAWDAYPVVGYLLDIWNITGDYVTAVVNELYASDDEVAGDKELQQWMQACSDPAHGNVRGVPDKVDTRDLLSRVLTSILYRVTVHGAGSLNAAVNPALSFVSNFPPCLQHAEIPTPDTEMTEEYLLELLPHTGTVGGMTTFYYTFVYSQPYARLIPEDGFDSEPYYSGAQKSCNAALFAYRKAISSFVTEYEVSWNKALERFRGTPGAPPTYAAKQDGQWPPSIEI